MENLYSEYTGKIKRNKEAIEKATKCKISLKGKKICVSGKAVNEFIAFQIIDAINFGFTTPEALVLCDENFIFEKINIKDLTKRRDLIRIRGRIIGTRGVTKQIIENLSDCSIALKDNKVGIIGHSENIEICRQAIISIIHGKKQGKVYTYLERERTKAKKEQVEDLGLKIKIK